MQRIKHSTGMIIIAFISTVLAVVNLFAPKLAQKTVMDLFALLLHRMEEFSKLKL